MIAKLRKVDLKKNQKLMIESVNDLSLSLCVYMLIRHTGMERKSIELKSERELQVPEVFVVFWGFFLDFLKHLIKFNNDMFNSV